MTIRASLTVAAAFAAAGTAHATITSTGPFSGDAFETFEAIASPGFVNGPIDIFGGQGQGYDTFANGTMIALNLFSFVSNTEVLPYNGNLMGGSVTGVYTFEFETLVSDFGGYFNTADEIGPTSVEFYDAGDNLIESVSASFPLGSWNWHGWHSDDGFAKVIVKGSPAPNFPITFDDLQVTFVPAPGAAALLALGGIAGVRRRR